MTSSSQSPFFAPPEPAEPPSGSAADEPVRPMPGRRNPPRRTSTSTVLLSVAGLVAVAGIAFAGGRLTAPAAAAVLPAGFTGTGLGSGTGTGGFGNGAGDTNGNRAGFGGLRGAGGAINATVTAVAPDHITVQLGGATGPSIDIKTDATTTYHTQQAASASAVTTGSKVLIQFATPAAGSSPRPSFQPGASPAPGGGFANAFSSRVAKDITVLAP
jgi:hypothetical protein